MALTERLAIVLETTGAGAVVRDFNKVAGAADGLGGKMQAVGGQLKGTLTGALPGLAASAAAGLVAFGAKAVQAFQDGALAALDMSRATGASVQDASRMIAAFDDMAISAEAGTKAMLKLTRGVETNSAGLAKYGIVAARDAQGNADMAETLLRVADAYNATSDPAKRAALVTEAFGKSGAELIPILEQGREGIAALYRDAAQTGQVFSPEDAKAADDLRMAVDGLHDALGQLSREAGRELTPAVTDLTNAAKDAVPWLSRIAGFGAWLVGLDGSFEATAESATGLARANTEAAQAAAEDAKALGDVEKATLAASSAQRAMTASARAVTTAEHNLADARAEVNKLLREGAVDEEKVADARRSLADATRSLGSAQRRLRESQEDSNEALAYFNAVGGDTAYDRLQDAQDNLADAADGVASARDRETDAQEDLDKALAGDPDFNDKLARAKRGLGDAETTLADAIFNSSQRAFELNDALDTQNSLLGTNAGQVATLRGEWAALLALKPELLPFLQGPMATLGAALPSPGGQGILTAPTENLSPVVNNNQQINVSVSGAVADPDLLARSILWNLP